MEAGNSAAADSLVERGAHSDDAAHTAAKERWAAAKLGDEDPQLTRRKEPEVSWMPDDASSSCTLCVEEFTLFNRRHHCRSCGTLVCYYCSTHSAPQPTNVACVLVLLALTRCGPAGGPLDIVATADGPELVDMERRTDERLCDGCFNYRSFFQYEEPAPPSSGRLSRTFSGSDGGSTGGGTGGGAALPAVVQTSGDREQLLGDARLGGGAERADGGGPASAAAVASEARDQLRANVERAEELAKKTEEMAGERARSSLRGTGFNTARCACRQRVRLCRHGTEDSGEERAQQFVVLSRMHAGLPTVPGPSCDTAGTFTSALKHLPPPNSCRRRTPRQGLQLQLVGHLQTCENLSEVRR